MIRPTPHFIHCSQCGWEHYQKTMTCEPSACELERNERLGFHGNACPECGSLFLTIKPGNTLKGKVLGWLWDMR